MKIPGNPGHIARPHAIGTVTSISPAETSRARLIKSRLAPDSSSVSTSTKALIRNAIRHASKPDAASDTSAKATAATGPTSSVASPPSSSPPNAPAGETLTIDGLLKAWGNTEQNSPYDLNADGAVNAADLAQLLARLGESADPPPDSTDASSSDEPDVTLKVDALLAAWGTDDPTYDLDGDGTVGPADLASLLAQLGLQPPAQPDTTSTVQFVSDPTLGPELVDPADGSAAPPQSKLDALLATWGTDNSDFDLNGDGSVGPADLAELLAQSSPSSPPENSGVAPPTTTGPATTSVSSPAVATNAPATSTEPDRADASRPHARPAPDALDRPQRVRLTQLSNQLFHELRERGFHQRPPMNIREIVSGLDLSQIEQKFLLSRLARRYPHGLGLNAVG